MYISAATLKRRTLKVTPLAGDSKVLDKSSIQTPRQTFKVFDENGEDVTPRPLHHPDPGSIQAKHSRVFANDASVATSSDFLSTLFQSTTNASFTWPFNRSFFGSSTVSRSSQSTMESINEEMEDPSSKRDILISHLVQVKRGEVKEQLREDMLDDVVDCCISETDTVILLEMLDVSVSVEADDADSVRERSQSYEELCKNRAGNDKYMERSMQTFNGEPKTMKIQTDRVNVVDAATMATTWDMYDSFRGAEQGETLQATDSGADQPGCPQGIVATREAEKTVSLVNSASIASTSSSRTEMDVFLVLVEDEADPALILNSESFQHSLVIMEKTILANSYQPRLAAYRQLAVLQDSDGVAKPSAATQSCVRREEGSLTPVLEPLWAFGCGLTAGYNASCMAWNKKNPDLLAVGYGQLEFKDRREGLVCCWSLKNITWPERIFHCKGSVASLDFSASNPNLMAVGLHEGSIAIFNVQSQEKTPGSSECVHKHVWPLWQVKWTEQEGGSSREERGEALISLSGDGRVSKWFQHKTLDCIDLIKLKRTHMGKKRCGEKERKAEAFISKLTPGLCFAFHPKESNIYLVGTEEGHIHKCSRSYNEHFLETYRAHEDPVYRITWSPFCSDVFLSCSFDWTVRLWSQGLHTPVLDFTSGYSAVYDVVWSPKWATVFAAVKQGQVEVWNLGSSILDPVIVYPAAPGVKLTSVLFTSHTDCILVGDSKGHVTVYQLKNLAVGEGDQVDTLEDIINSYLVR